jgi:hypothetical protein
MQWQGFVRKNALASTPTQFAAVVAQIAPFLDPIISAARSAPTFIGKWPAGGPWKSAI